MNGRRNIFTLRPSVRLSVPPGPAIGAQRLGHCARTAGTYRLAVAAGGRARGACAPGGTVQGAAFGGAKYGILKSGHFWRIIVRIAERIRREFA